ncbi:MAG: NUDIX domain-containing protein [Prevotellaceae bacterium]|jgi:ADP-ribose pyrophosphatase YjhB (NUDIX family)|nr:NUDIX domain-containing protein [Prevotellaceae bacterium]
MFKIFFNDRYIAITSCYEACFSVLGSVVYTIQSLEETPSILEQFIANDELVKLHIYTGNLNEESVIAAIRSSFKNIVAAGGLVRNIKNEILMIYRFKHWDLPKGAHEENESIEETAIREVKEECGLDGLAIVKPIINTYHIYERNNTRVLKRTHWFELLYAKDKQPTPQTEEGVEKAIWLSQDNIQPYLKKAYPSIREVFNAASRINP